MFTVSWRQLAAGVVVAEKTPDAGVLMVEAGVAVDVWVNGVVGEMVPVQVRVGVPEILVPVGVVVALGVGVSVTVKKTVQMEVGVDVGVTVDTWVQTGVEVEVAVSGTFVNVSSGVPVAVWVSEGVSVSVTKGVNVPVMK
jgi:hypothetical protein